MTTTDDDRHHMRPVYSSAADLTVGEASRAHADYLASEVYERSELHSAEEKKIDLLEQRLREVTAERDRLLGMLSTDWARDDAAGDPIQNARADEREACLALVQSMCCRSGSCDDATCASLRALVERIRRRGAK